MRPTTNAFVLLALSAMIGACESAAKTIERRPLLAEVPLDSLIKTIGPDVAKHHIGGGGGTSSDVGGRSAVTYTAVFNAPVVDLNMISYLGAKMQEIVLHRGGRVGGGSSVGAFTTFDYSADSRYGFVAIAAIKNDQPNHANYESLVIFVREVAVPDR